MTNYHCLAGEPFVSGFYAKTQEDEVRIPMVLDQLVEIDEWMSLEKTDGQCELVSDEVVEEALLSCMERSAGLLCRWVERVSGGNCQYSIYKYRRFYDVRLVFAPELSIGIPEGRGSKINLDGVHAHRYRLDVAFVRAYRGGEPLSTEHYLSFSKMRVKEGDLIFASGSPGEESSDPHQCFLQGYDPPDSTPRLTYGAVQGYFDGVKFHALSFSLGDVFEKAPQKSISLPARWHRAKKKLSLDVLYGFSGTIPVAGGSSGSPILNKDAEVIGLAAQAEAQDVCSYDEGYRTYSITSEVIVELLGKVYGADRLVKELGPHAPPALDRFIGP